MNDVVDEARAGLRGSDNDKLPGESVYLVYNVLGVQCTRCAMYSVYNVLCVQCTRCAMYSVYKICGFQL